MGACGILPMIFSLVTLLTVIRIFRLANEVKTRIDVLEVELDVQDLRNQNPDAEFAETDGSNDE
jgi:hypothetical protein